MVKPKVQTNVWQIYFFLIAFILVKMNLSFISPKNDSHTFYTTLIAFDKRFILHYLAHHTFLITNLIALFFLARFSWDKPPKYPFVCQILLLIKIFFDITGNLYFTNQLEMLFKQSLLIFLLQLLTAVGIYLPGYLGLYFYGLKQTQKDI